ncbi:VirB4 family type IV secretion/conjugal transfer ATPase, partial [Acinetobacter baumannii]
NHWGDAVALLKTASGSPYYFNFHRADLGNTMIIGPSGSGKTVAQGFLLAMLEKFSPTGVFFDKDRGAEIFIRAMGGQYQPLLTGVPTG